MTTAPKYPAETSEGDDGRMPENVQELADAVVGHRIVKVEPKAKAVRDHFGYRESLTGTALWLDNGKRVTIVDTDDCCAYTDLEAFLLNIERVDHIITGVGTTGEFHHWHVYADAGDVMEFTVNWSAGNPFYYGYGFVIIVDDGPAERQFESAVRDA